ncbi:MAG: GAF domain-containing protein [Bacteroidota bacterium]|nr:GAF domain-containing protein [Bacteroidota bacterium]
MNRLFFTLLALVTLILAVAYSFFWFWVIGGVTTMLAASLWWAHFRQRRIERALSTPRVAASVVSRTQTLDEDILLPPKPVSRPVEKSEVEPSQENPGSQEPASSERPPSSMPATESFQSPAVRAESADPRTSWFRHTDPELGPFARLLGGWLEMLLEFFQGHSALLYWINPAKEQFVLEAYVTASRHFMLGERVSWSSVFLDRYRHKSQAQVLQVGQELDEAALYYYVPSTSHSEGIRSVLLLPVLFDKPEPVALLVLDSRQRLTLGPIQSRFLAHNQEVLRSLLQVYSDYFELKHQEKAWGALQNAQRALIACTETHALWEELLRAAQDLTGCAAVLLAVQDAGAYLVRHRAERPLWPLGLEISPASLLGEVLKKGKSRYEPDLAQFGGLLLRRQEPPVRTGSLFAAPLMLAGRIWGALAAYHPLPEYFIPVRRFLLEELAHTAGLMLAVARRGGERDRGLLAKEMDPSTKLFTREALLAIARAQLNVADSPRGVLLLRPDELEALRVHRSRNELSALMHQLARTVGGEGLPALAWGWMGEYELGAVWTAPELGEVALWARQLLHKLQQAGGDIRDQGFTLSIGLAPAQEGMGAEQLFVRARAALDAAQATGGNRVQWAD